MAALTWNASGAKKYETGVSKVALYLAVDGEYPEGVAWEGVTAITEKPSGADATALYAENVKYANLIAAEEFGATIEAYTYPDEFAECDGSVSIGTGITIGQQKRKTFGLSWESIIGNDIDGESYGYKIKLAYGLTAAPSERSNNTVNESPEAMTMSWELTSTPVAVKIGNTEYKPTSIVTIDSTKFTTEAQKTKLAAFEKTLRGSADASAKLPLPAEVATLLAVAG